VILNPDSGPGASPYTVDEYMLQILKINNFTNVETVGYVHTSFATRNISDVLEDVAIYSGWNTNANATTGSKLAVHGIFFDEAPSEYTEATAQYMLAINQAVKNASGFLGDKTVRKSALLI
jgi:Spherulation-specific family 4